MSLEGLSVDNDIQGESDRLGGSFIWDTDAYECEIEAAFVGEAASGAMSVTYHFKNEQDKVLKPTIYVTSGKKKGCKPYYENGKGEKVYLPGFNQATAIGLVAAGKDLAGLNASVEKKTINLYDYDEKKDMPKAVDMIMELIGTKVIIGVEKQVVDKTKKDDQTGKYEPTGETREQNEVVKIFSAKENNYRKTVTEIRAKTDEAAFYDKWVTENQGQVVNKAKGTAKTGATQGMPGAADTPADSGEESLFG